MPDDGFNPLQAFDALIRLSEDLGFYAEASEGLDLAPIKARLAAATPGPWQLENEHQAEGLFVARVQHLLVLPEHQHLALPEHDARFIAHAPEDIACLIQEVERLRANAKPLTRKE